MTISLPWLSHLFFILIRLGTVLLLSPIQAIRQLPFHVRFILVFTLSLLISQWVPQSEPMTDSRLFLGAITEFVNGLILATSLYATFSVFQIAGQLIDNQMGLNLSAVFNPSEHTQETISSHLLSMLAVLFFFGLDAHVWLLKGLAFSFKTIPPGTLALFAGLTPIIKQFGLMFAMAVMMASPIVLALLIIDLSAAVITRNMPQLNAYFLTLPIKVLLGFFVLTLLFPLIIPLSNKLFNQCFLTWQELMS